MVWRRPLWRARKTITPVAQTTLSAVPNRRKLPRPGLGRMAGLGRGPSARASANGILIGRDNLLEAVMKAKRKWIWLLLLVPVAGVSWQIYDHFRYWPTPAKAGSTIYAEVGYEALRPTLDYLAPGVLYTVEKRGEGFVNLRPTCEVDDGALTNAIQVRRTTDVSSTITRKLSAGIDVPRENWSKLTLNANLEGVQNIKVVYSNSRVELLSTEKIRALRESYLKQASCSAAVEFELEHGYMVCQTDAAIILYI